MATLIGSGYDALRHLVVYGQPFIGLTLMFVWSSVPHLPKLTFAGFFLSGGGGGG